MHPILNIKHMAQRKIIFYKHYYLDFYVKQTESVKKKINQVLVWIQSLDHIPITLFKSIESVNGLYEIRITLSGNIYRIFCCFDDGNLIVLFNAFQKKTQKTPDSEIHKAKTIMETYFKEKKGK